MRNNNEQLYAQAVDCHSKNLIKAKNLLSKIDDDELYSADNNYKYALFLASIHDDDILAIGIYQKVNRCICDNCTGVDKINGTTIFNETERNLLNENYKEIAFRYMSLAQCFIRGIK